ncbi:hypothetical protein ONA92_17040 [Mycobacteroides salmoniphilum]|uniref:hypothetical protein n=1 Tax=Mycobacteroides salmoniphilum TaxID=404941 RepID=UPI003567F17B
MTAKTIAVTVGLIGAAILSACTATAEPTTPTEPTKSGDASRFPDLSSYTPVNIADYRIDTTSPGHPSSGTYFLTPDGITCNFPTLAAQCTGNNFPGVPPAATGVNWVGTMTQLRQTGDSIASGGIALGQQIKTLPPFHSITVSDVTCGVDDKGTTACKDPQGRAFVLSPSWSGWIPKV